MKEINTTTLIEPTVTIETQDSPHALDSAPDEVKLAVDLIYLLESSDVEKITAIKALEIVLNDFKKK